MSKSILFDLLCKLLIAQLAYLFGLFGEEPFMAEAVVEVKIVVLGTTSRLGVLGGKWG